jgi:hypothetical protein
MLVIDDSTIEIRRKLLDNVYIGGITKSQFPTLNHACNAHNEAITTVTNHNKHNKRPEHESKRGDHNKALQTVTSVTGV